MAKPMTVEAYVTAPPEPLREVGAQLRPLLDAALPDAAPVLWCGQTITDPPSRLEPGAREMAQVKLRTPADVDPPCSAPGYARPATKNARPLR